MSPTRRPCGAEESYGFGLAHGDVRAVSRSESSGVGPRIAGQIPVEVIDHLSRIVLDAEDERGFAPPQHG